MAIEQASFHCPQCRQQRLFTRQGTNHVIHLLVTLFLCGLWVPIWILIAISDGSKPYFCSRCGFSGSRYNLANQFRQQQTRQIRQQPAKPSRIEEQIKALWLHFRAFNTQKQVLIGSAAAVSFLCVVVTLALLSAPNRNATRFVSSPSAASTPYVTPKAASTPAALPTVMKTNSSPKSATVITENATLRKSAGQSGEIIELLPANATVEVVKQSGAWFLVKSAGGQQGWMHGNTIRYVKMFIGLILTCLLEQ
jgi:hypothetical protein